MSVTWVLRKALELGVFSVYRLARLSPFSNSTVYYAVERLSREGAVRCASGVCKTEAGAYLAYYRSFGCDDILTAAVRREFGKFDRDEICSFFELVRGCRGGTWLDLAAVAVLRGARNRLVAAVAAKYGVEIDGLHRGIYINGVFAGYCKRCGLVVLPCRIER